jgi:hypothetical protein
VWPVRLFQLIQGLRHQTYGFVVVRHLTRNVAGVVACAMVVLTIFEASHHRVTVLPADASVVPVVASAALLGLLLTAVEERVRRRLW